MARVSPLSRLQFVPENCELSEVERNRNAASHRIGVVDDCYRCIYCEIGSWNAWKMACPA
jgi:hypothetical protein